MPYCLSSPLPLSFLQHSSSPKSQLQTAGQLLFSDTSSVFPISIKTAMQVAGGGRGGERQCTTPLSRLSRYNAGVGWGFGIVGLFNCPCASAPKCVRERGELLGSSSLPASLADCHRRALSCTHKLNLRNLYISSNSHTELLQCEFVYVCVCVQGSDPIISSEIVKWKPT